VSVGTDCCGVLRLLLDQLWFVCDTHKAGRVIVRHDGESSCAKFWPPELGTIAAW
jgi:hypothetical protein